MQFERWLWIEVVMIIAYISGGALYILISKIKKASLFMSAPARDDIQDPDFVDKNMMMIDTT